MALLILAVFGAICALVANGKGRSPIGWFFIGFLAPILGLILVFVLPDLKEAERRFNRLGKQNRLLRERLRQSKAATRRRLSTVDRRLGAHDRSLDMDTGQPDQSEPLPYYEEEDGDEDDFDRDSLGARRTEAYRAPPVRAAARGTERVPQRASPVGERPIRSAPEERTAAHQARPALPRRPPPRRPSS